MAEAAKEKALADAKIATKLALDKIPSVETHIDYPTAKENWKLTTTIEVTKTTEAAASKESR